MIKIRYLLVCIFLAGIFFSGCNRGVPTRAERLEKFEKILPADIRKEFSTGNYSLAAKMMEDQYRVNKIFQARLDKIKDDECINIFSVQEVVGFYRDYFVNHEKNK